MAWQIRDVNYHHKTASGPVHVTLMVCFVSVDRLIAVLSPSQYVALGRTYAIGIAVFPWLYANLVYTVGVLLGLYSNQYVLDLTWYISIFG